MTKIYVPKENVSDNTVKVTDIYFKNKKILAKIGQNVVAGESLIASE